MDLDFRTFDEIPLIIKAAFVAAICGLVFYFAYMFDFSYTLRVIHGNAQKEADLKIQYQALVDTKKTLENNIADFPQLLTTLAEWQGQLIKPTELPELLNEILKIGTNNNLQFDLFNPGEKIKDDIYYKLPIKILAQGSYNQIADFISQIANMKWLIAIDNIIIAKKGVLAAAAKSDALVSNGALLAEVNLEVYYRASK
jgi:type IV pilus assembly protein PilO